MQRRTTSKVWIIKGGGRVILINFLQVPTLFIFTGMGTREMYLISPQELERLKSQKKSPVVEDDRDDMEIQTPPAIIIPETNPDVELLALALEGVNIRYKTSALQLLKHLSFINQSSERFKFDTSDFGIILDGKKIAKSNLVEIINTAFKRAAPVSSEEQNERQKKNLNIPGFYAFLRLLGSIGIPSSMFPNPLIADYIRRSRH